VVSKRLRCIRTVVMDAGYASKPVLRRRSSFKRLPNQPAPQWRHECDERRRGSLGVVPASDAASDSQSQRTRSKSYYLIRMVRIAEYGGDSASWSRILYPALAGVKLCDWSGRWESKTPLGHCAPFRIMVLQAWQSAACDYCVENGATRANASQCRLC
jgi:hypothetical protein